MTLSAATTPRAGTSRSSSRWGARASVGSSPAVEPELVPRSATSRGCPGRLRRCEPPSFPNLAQPTVLRHYLRLSQMTLGVRRHIPSARHLHHEVQPDGQRAARRAPRDERAASAAGRRNGAGDHRDHLPLRADALRDLGDGPRSRSNRAAARRRSSPTPASFAPTTQPAAREQRTRSSRPPSPIPIDCAGPAAAGFGVITSTPGPNGYPELEALKAAVSERTAGLMIPTRKTPGSSTRTSRRSSTIVHEAGGLCAYDQANANGILGHHPRPRRTASTSASSTCTRPSRATRLDGTAVRGRGSPRSWRGSCRPDGRVRRSRASLGTTTGRIRSARSVPSTASRRPSFVRTPGS